MTKERGNRALRSVDRYIGIPLVLLVRLASPLFRGRRAPAQSPAAARPPTIGLLATGAIGDLIIASGIVNDLRSAWPEARLLLFVSHTNASAVELIPEINRAVTLPITRPWQAVSLLRQEPMDWLLDFGPWPRINALLTALSGARHTVGFEAPRQHRHYLYDHAVVHQSARHQLDNLRALLDPLGIPGKRAPSVQMSKSLPPGLPDRFIVFHPWPGGYRSKYKRWSTNNWLALAKGLSQYGWPIVLTGGPADGAESSALATRLRAEEVRVIDTASRCTLGQTAALLKQAAAVVTVDTGVMHLAAAVDAPVISLHGPTHSRRWGGVGAGVTSINAPGSDCGYLDLGFEYPSPPPDCMERICVDCVLTAVLAVIGRSQSEPARTMNAVTGSLARSNA